MGIIVNKDNNQNDDLSRRIAADLQAKLSGNTGVIEGETPDLVDDSDYIEDYKKTSKFGWVWIVLIVLAVLALFSIIAL